MSLEVKNQCFALHQLNLFDSFAPLYTQDHSVEAHLVLHECTMSLHKLHVLVLWNFLAKRKKFRFIYEQGIGVITHQQEQHRSIIERHLLLHKLLLHGNIMCVTRLHPWCTSLWQGFVKVTCLVLPVATCHGHHNTQRQ